MSAVPTTTRSPFAPTTRFSFWVPAPERSGSSTLVQVSSGKTTGPPVGEAVDEPEGVGDPVGVADPVPVGLGLSPPDPPPEKTTADPITIAARTGTPIRATRARDGRGLGRGPGPGSPGPFTGGMTCVSSFAFARSRSASAAAR